MSLLGTSCRDAGIRPEAGRSRGEREREPDRHRKRDPGSRRQGAAKTQPHRPTQGGRGIPPITGRPEAGLHPAEVPCGPCLQPRGATGSLWVLRDGWEIPPPRPALALGCHPQLPRRLKWKPPGSPLGPVSTESPAQSRSLVPVVRAAPGWEVPGSWCPQQSARSRPKFSSGVTENRWTSLLRGKGKASEYELGI